MLFKNMDNKEISLVTLRDLSKGFDSVYHKILLHKLSKFNIGSFWFREYLLDKKQAMKINSTLSDLAETTHGVPQGSMLGPIMFTIFINDLSETINNCKVVQYADDTQFIHSATLDALPHLITQAQATLTPAKAYFSTNGFILNSQKKQYLFVGTRTLIKRTPKHTIIRFDNTYITPSKHVKNLGLYMDCHMTFEKHINEIYKKVIGTLLLINRIREKFENNIRTMVVQSLALSVMNYCLQIYGSTNNTLMHKIQKLQNFAAKICVRGAKRNDIFITRLQWLKVKDKFTFDLAVTVFKTIKKKAPRVVFGTAYSL